MTCILLALLRSILVTFNQFYDYEPAFDDSPYDDDEEFESESFEIHPKRSTTLTSRNEAANSSALTYEVITNMNKSLPKTLGDFKSQCWFEKCPKDFRYQNSFYYKYDCQGQKALKGDFDWLDKEWQKRCQDESGCVRLRCFPYFFVVGAPKSGTTDLHHTLARYHPHFVSGSKKESQFWTRRRHGITSTHICPESLGQVATFDDYLTLYDKAAMHINRIRQGDDQYHPVITGDFTPDDMFYLWQWHTMPGNEGQSEPRVTLAHHLHQLSPSTKIIFILRDPVERYRSHFYFYKNDKTLTPNDLHRHVLQAISVLQDCLKLHTPLYCATEKPFALAQGMYSVFVESWLRVFDKEQVMVIRFEDYANNRLSVLKDIGSFLGLDPSLSRNTDTLRTRKAALTGHHKKGMSAETETILRDFYRSYNQRLASLFQDQKWTWGY